MTSDKTVERLAEIAERHLSDHDKTCSVDYCDTAYLLAAVKDARREGMLAGMLEAAREVENFCVCTDDQATPEEIENHQCPAEKAIRKRASEL